jgi:predicted alpha/beta-hydrolase family hydrolase
MSFIFDGPENGPLFVFAHGAGAPASSAFMQQVSEGLAAEGIRVARFNFLYSIKTLEDGKRRPPDRQPKLLAHFAEQLQRLGKPAVIGGKSMGGRMASLLAANIDNVDESNGALIKGCACLGYPFHPNGKPDKLRIEHLPMIHQPVLIIQGTRDPMGNKEEVLSYHLPSGIEWHWLADGNHDFKPRIASGFKHQQHLSSAINVLAAFIKQQR